MKLALWRRYGDGETKLVGGAEFESATPWMSTKYSNQLN